MGCTQFTSDRKFSSATIRRHPAAAVPQHLPEPSAAAPLESRSRATEAVSSSGRRFPFASPWNGAPADASQPDIVLVKGAGEVVLQASNVALASCPVATTVHMIRLCATWMTHARLDDDRTPARRNAWHLRPTDRQIVLETALSSQQSHPLPRPCDLRRATGSWQRMASRWSRCRPPTRRACCALSAPAGCGSWH